MITTITLSLNMKKTRKVKEDDRTNHIVTTEAQTGAVFLTYKGIDEVNAVVNETMEKNEPVYDFTSPDGVKTHYVGYAWPTITILLLSKSEKLKTCTLQTDTTRAASAARAQKVKMEKNPNHTGKEEYNYFLAVLFPAEQLKILPYNRAVLNMTDDIKADFFDRIKANWTIEDTDSPNPPENKISMYVL